MDNLPQSNCHIDFGGKCMWYVCSPQTICSTVIMKNEANAVCTCIHTNTVYTKLIFQNIWENVMRTD